MGVDTKAIIRKGTTLEQISDALKTKYSDVEITNTYSENSFRATFKDGEDQRQMWISYDSTVVASGIDGIWMSLGFWGDSVGIMRFLCETFGGYLDESDSDNEPFYPINFHLFKQGKEFSEIDSFRNKVISKLGYGNLKITMELFEEFKNITK